MRKANAIMWLKVVAMKAFGGMNSVKQAGKGVWLQGKVAKLATALVAIAFLANVNSPMAYAFGLLSSSQTVTMTQQNMPRLSKGNYAAWAKVEGKDILVGQFNIDTSGNMVDLKGRKKNSFSLGQNIGSASEIFVTIESSEVKGRGPSSIKIQRGKVSGNASSLSFPIDYSGAKGSFMLGAMSKETDNAIVPVKTGIWFVSPQGNQVKKGLMIPDAPKGWSYSGWMRMDQKSAVKMGKFTSPSSSDDFNGYSPALSPPKFPGENFLQNPPQGYSFPQNIDGATTWITLEPAVDVGASPFPLVLFVKKVPTGQAAGKNVDFENSFKSFPTTKVSIK